MSTRPLYSSRLYGVSGLTTSSGMIAPPVGSIFVVRDIDAYSSTFTSTTLRFKDYFSAGTLWVATNVALGAAYFSWRGRQVFTVTEPFEIEASGDPWDVYVSGYVLTV